MDIEGLDAGMKFTILLAMVLTQVIDNGIDPSNHQTKFEACQIFC